MGRQPDVEDSLMRVPWVVRAVRAAVGAPHT